MPLEATQHTADGAKAFAAFFIKTIDWGYATTSGAYIRHYALNSCTACAGFADAIDRAKSADHRYVGGRMTMTSTRLASTALVHGASTTAIVAFNILSFEELTKGGSIVHADGAHRGEQFEVSLNWQGHGWMVRALAANG